MVVVPSRPVKMQDIRYRAVVKFEEIASPKHVTFTLPGPNSGSANVAANPATKRPRKDSFSSAPSTTRPKLFADGTSDRPILLEESDNSDDEPPVNVLAARLSARSSGRTKQVPELNRRRRYSEEKCGDLVHASGSEDAQSSQPNACSMVFDDQETEEAVPAAHGASATPSTKGSVYGKMTNLTPVFKSISSVAKTSPRPSPFAKNFLGHRRVSSPDRLFTNTRLKELNQLIRSMDKPETTEGAIPSSVSKRNTSGKRKRGTGEKSLAEDMGAQKHNATPEALALSEYNGHAYDNTPKGFDDSDEAGEALMGDEIDEYAASPAVEKKLRMNDKRIADNPAQFLARTDSKARPDLCSQEERSQARIGRTARSTPATDFVDLTEDDPIQETLNTPQNDTPSLADRLFPKLPSPPPPAERPEYTQKHGLSLRAATLTVNAALRPSIPKFSEAKGKRQIRSFVAQGKLAIRHDLVYHPDCDPGPDAPAPRPVHGVSLSLAQKVMQECRRAEMSPCRSTFGKIGEARFRVFEARLYSAVKVEKTLFQQGEETLEGCVKMLNEWMIEGKFVKVLTEALCLLRENMELRSRLYKDEADDSRLGHTPFETRARFDSAEHNELRRSMKNHHPSTPDDTTPPVYSSFALSIDPSPPSLSVEGTGKCDSGRRSEHAGAQQVDGHFSQRSNPPDLCAGPARGNNTPDSWKGAIPVTEVYRDEN
ncbi:hypothetical protein EJ07DRAFT_160065 [Lizonia empirigonia]|nr:hypothetical protein EJ07DRAFT_160065 [Lizonia empirigonia]